ncbi:vWA domain-containing protein [Kosmotoga arenicorallina]|uniref:vWA domain-containing protein n=1 Tax=Kosmotoga arenicorallina TaxID=688066 RepID=UPI001372E32F|nr:vWA domain-containing protein [Kosmotoga arenicorallina]
MKKLLRLLLASAVILLASCGIIPVLQQEIPLDPFGVKIPGAWGNDLEIFFAIDKLPSSNPLFDPVTSPMPLKLRMSIPDYLGSLDDGKVLVFEDGKAQGFVMTKETEVRIGADIVFLVDTTGSMSDEISGIKSSIQDFLQALIDAGYDAKASIIPFGDYAPSDPVYEGANYSTPFINLSSPGAASDYSTELVAYGGRDLPENIYGAIMFAWNNINWRPHAERVIILLTDAFSHYTGDQPPDIAWPYGIVPENDFSAKYTKQDVLEAIYGYATFHIIASTGTFYFESDTDFSHPGDPRELVNATSGLTIYQEGSEEPDLSEIGLTEYILSSWLIFFETDSYINSHDLSVFVELPDGTQGRKELSGVIY